MRKIAKYLPALLVLGALLIVPAAIAKEQSRGQCPGAGFGHMGGIGAIINDLSKEQKEAIHKIMVELEKEMIDLRASLEKKHIELRELMIAADEAKLYAKIDEIGKLRTDIQKKRVKMMLDIRNLLTDEQKEKLEGMMPMMGCPGGPGGAPGQGHCPGGMQGHMQGQGPGPSTD